MRRGLLLEPRVVFREHGEPDPVHRLELVACDVERVFGIGDERADVGPGHRFRVLCAGREVASDEVVDGEEGEAG